MRLGVSNLISSIKLDVKYRESAEKKTFPLGTSVLIRNSSVTLVGNIHDLC